MLSCISFVVVVVFAALLLCCVTAIPADSPKPTWWKSYCKKFGRKHIKRCLFLQEGEIPTHGAACPSVGVVGSGWYMCLFGTDQTCTATTGPLPGLGGITGVGLGNVHPSMKCACLDMVWSCHEWKPCSSPPNVYRSTSGALDLELSLFSKDILKGYNLESKLDSALIEVAKFIVNKVIATQKAEIQIVISSEIQSRRQQETTLASFSDETSSFSKSRLASGKIANETNNQEGGVDEDDAVKSDGRYVYAAYGDILVVWDALTGNKITNITMPAIQTPSEPAAAPAPTTAPAARASIVKIIDFFARPYHQPVYQPRPKIRSLLLEFNRLVVIIEGYEYAKRDKMNITSSVFSHLLATHVRVYDTSTLSSSGQLSFVKDMDINGFFQGAWVINGNIHIVTSTSLDTWELLSAPLKQWRKEFKHNLTEEEYTAQAAAFSKDKLIPAFIKQLKEDINLLGSPKLVGISIWESVLSGMEEFIFGGEVFQAYTQVSSFSVTDADLKLSLAGVFVPSYPGYKCTRDMLILSAEGWDWLPAKKATGPTTYFLGFKLVGAHAIPAVIGSIPGRLLNKDSMNIFEDHLRVATNVPIIWRWPEFDGSSASLIPIQELSTENQIVILKIPSVVEEEDDVVLTKVGHIAKLGMEGERFTAVRYFDKFAYVVTFEKTDSFYVLDLDVSNPQVLGKLEITEFSSYLHSLNADNTLLLAIVEEVDAEGQVLGLRFSLFDTTNPTKPILLQKYTIEKWKFTLSFPFGTVLWNLKEFQYHALDVPEVGVLIIPIQVYAPYPSTTGNFDGFLMYDVSRQGILLRGGIPHIKSNQFYGCYFNNYLPQRSFVSNGNVTTVKWYSVMSTDLDTFKNTWELQLDDGVDRGQGCFYGPY